MAKAESKSPHNPRWQPRERAEPRPCAAEGCSEVASYPAPKSRDALGEYQWFCINHIREFNSGWNFLEGMNSAQIEAFIRQSTVGERPTRPLGIGGAGSKLHEAMLRARLAGDFGQQFQGSKSPEAEAEFAAISAGFSVAEVKACRALGLAATRDFKRIKKRYRELAKQLHPDVNGHDSATETEKLKAINQAYAVLKAAAMPEAQ